MWNLTVSEYHTYYVLAGATPVLVHNDDGPMFDTSRQARQDAMRRAGLPISMQPRSAVYYSGGHGQGGGYQYVYEYNGKTWLVTDNWNDLNADKPHGPLTGGSAYAYVVRHQNECPRGDQTHTPTVIAHCRGPSPATSAYGCWRCITRLDGFSGELPLPLGGR